MSSPVSLVFLNYIQLDRNSSTPIYLQITQQMINVIQRGYLNPGDKLPGTRIIAQELKINRNTIVIVYNELQAQGWIEILPNKGTFVLFQHKNPITERPYQSTISLQKYPEKTGFSFYKSIILDNPKEEVQQEYYWTDGTTDMRLNQFKQLASLYSAAMNRKSTIKNLIQSKEHNANYFKSQLSNYLNQTRGLHISKDNLLISRSSEMSLYMLSRVLIQAEDIVIVAELSNPSVNMTFLQAGAKIQTLAIDANGIRIDSLKEQLKKSPIRAVYITPHHHYPTTVTLQASRRIELLQLAQKHNFIIIEDDYDYDFHYDKTAISPIASADVNGMVVYTGTFGKSLAPSFQTSFIVAPKDLISELDKYRVLLDKQGDSIMEQALGEMIEEGNMHRHIKKVNQIYRQRRDMLCQQLDHYFPEGISYFKPSGGLALWVNFKKSISLNKVRLEALNKKLTIPLNILYQNKNITAIRIGFGHMNEDEIKASVAILRQTVDKISD